MVYPVGYPAYQGRIVSTLAYWNQVSLDATVDPLVQRALHGRWRGLKQTSQRDPRKGGPSWKRNHESKSRVSCCKRDCNYDTIVLWKKTKQPIIGKAWRKGWSSNLAVLTTFNFNFQKTMTSFESELRLFTLYRWELDRADFFVSQQKHSARSIFSKRNIYFCVLFNKTKTQPDRLFQGLIFLNVWGGRHGVKYWYSEIKSRILRWILSLVKCPSGLERRHSLRWKCMWCNCCSKDTNHIYMLVPPLYIHGRLWNSTRALSRRLSPRWPCADAACSDRWAGSLLCPFGFCLVTTQYVVACFGFDTSLWQTKQFRNILLRSLLPNLYSYSSICFLLWQVFLVIVW